MIEYVQVYALEELMFFNNYKYTINGVYVTDKLCPLWSTPTIGGRKNTNVLIVDDIIIDGVIVLALG
jgi:hypothetical protein